jgi:hypothetical protein
VPSLSQLFVQTARRHFAFLVEEFGFRGPTIKAMGWQSTDLYYRKGSISVAVNLDMEESVLVTVELWDGPAKAAYQSDERNRFGPILLARFRDPAWPLPNQKAPVKAADLDGIFEDEVAALRTHCGDVLAGRTDDLRPFLDALRR